MSVEQDIANLKSKFICLEEKLKNNLKELEDKTNNFEILDKQLNEIICENNPTIKLNIGGKVFKIKKLTLTKYKCSLFSKLIDLYTEKNLPLNELFIDRDPEYFGIILDYVRTGLFDNSLIDEYNINKLYNESTYYGIQDLTEKLDFYNKPIKLIKFTSSPRYSSNVGTHNLEDILKGDLLIGGICVISPYEIIFELELPSEISSIEIGGYCGNVNSWNPSNGSNAIISTSIDNKCYNEVGKLPNDFGKFIQHVCLKLSKAKFIKFKHSNYLGIGYLKINKSFKQI